MRPSINWLLALIPVTLALEHAGAPAPWVFFAAALAIVPIARLIVRSTEQLATYTGDAVGGLLNATFGNAPELIIALVALRAGLLDMVRASLVGAILANLLLALGIAFLLGGLRFHKQTYNAAAARVYSSMMLIAAISLTGAERVQPLLRARGDRARGSPAQRRPRRRAARRLRALPRLHAEDASRRVRGRRRPGDEAHHGPALEPRRARSGASSSRRSSRRG